MRLYENTIQGFKIDVTNNQIAEKLSEKYLELRGKHIRSGSSEYRSWDESLNRIKNVLDYVELSDNRIVLEYEPPYSENRIDVLLFGRDRKGADNAIIIELKQWSNDGIKDCDSEGNIFVKFYKGEKPHPSLQVQGYYYQVRDLKEVFEEKPEMLLYGCTYCHNYKKGPDEVLYLPKFNKATSEYPIFSKEEMKELGEYLREKLGAGGGLEVLNRFDRSAIRPSKKLLDHTKDMINKQQIFNLIDDQIAAYNTIMHKAKKLSNSDEKSVIIVKGGPGTGKSVIALEVMGELLRIGKDVYHVTGSSAFTNTLRNILGPRAAQRFKFFYGFSDRKNNEVEVLICDEAHRLRKDSFDFRVPKKYKSRNPQIDDLIRPAKLSIFFIDEKQIVRPNEIGNIDLIKEAAAKHGANVSEFELNVQFRCGGSAAYLQWLENTLGIKDSEMQILTKKEHFDFRIVDKPEELKKMIAEKNAQKANCARIVAGFCWKWSPPNPDGTLVNDVKIDGFEMPWEKKDSFWKWATHISGMEQVGTVYTSQGFEFDYIGVIFGDDLVYDPSKKQWIGVPKNSHDSMVAKKNNEKLTEHLKNVYRVLMSRAHKGVYVYFMDKDTENFFRSKIDI